MNTWRNTKLVLSSLLIIITVVTSCQKDCVCDMEPENTVADEYYVKYEVTGTTIYLGGTNKYTIRDESNNLVSFSASNKHWDATIGPVERGFLASLSVEAEGNTHNKLRLQSKIYVSKNGSPFALKHTNDSDEPRDYLYSSYTIDY